VIADSGEQLGVMSPAQALALARERKLDLVEISPGAEPPVCKIMDFGKYKYLLKKKQQDAKKHQHVVVVKEVKFRPKIEKHDYEFKLRHAREFLEEGHKVKITIQFRGREITRPELAHNLIRRIEGDTKDIGELEQRPMFEGRTMITIMTPLAKGTKPKPKAPAKAAAEKKADGVPAQAAAPSAATPKEKPAPAAPAETKAN